MIVMLKTKSIGKGTNGRHVFGRKAGCLNGSFLSSVPVTLWTEAISLEHEQVEKSVQVLNCFERTAHSYIFIVISSEK